MNILHFSHVSPTYCVITHLYSRSALRGDDAISRVNNQGPTCPRSNTNIINNPSPTNQERLLIQEIYCQTPKTLVIQWKSPADQSKNMKNTINHPCLLRSRNLREFVTFHIAHVGTQYTAQVQYTHSACRVFHCLNPVMHVRAIPTHIAEASERTYT